MHFLTEYIFKNLEHAFLFNTVVKYSKNFFMNFRIPRNTFCPLLVRGYIHMHIYA